MVIAIIKSIGPINEILFTSLSFFIVAPTKGKKPKRPGKENTAYRIAEKNQLPDAFNVTTLLASRAPCLRENDPSNNVIIAVVNVKVTIYHYHFEISNF